MTMFDHDGGRGVKNSENLTTWYMDAPFYCFHVCKIKDKITTKIDCIIVVRTPDDSSVLRTNLLIHTNRMIRKSELIQLL